MSTPQLATFKVPAIENEPMVSPCELYELLFLRLNHVGSEAMLQDQQSVRASKLPLLRCNKNFHSRFPVS